ncbi:tail fiber protein [Desulfocurvibacter africanus]|uniref:tail fiber protein n=1 Tax=Desulfocurvibacter africanus TaxID=873 RepID=UPI00042267C8|nr:tail fiber protein [Desulfocurvibacter africanus]
MHRIDHATAQGGLFTEGDPQTALPATVVTDDWLNSVQEEIVKVVVDGGGAALNKADNGQLLAAIQKIVQDNLLPAGTCVDWSLDTPPTGFFVRNGANYAPLDYANLFAAIGYRYGRVGDNFCVPDDRGKVTRYTDLGRGMDPDAASRFMRRTCTTASGSAVITAINGTVPFAVGQAVSGPGIPAGATIVNIDSATQLTISAAATASAAGVELRIVVGDVVGSEQDDATKTHYHVDGLASSGSGLSRYGHEDTGAPAARYDEETSLSASNITVGHKTSSVGGAETRGKNTSKLPLIKY